MLPVIRAQGSNLRREITGQGANLRRELDTLRGDLRADVGDCAASFQGGTLRPPPND
jgi:hypothetical protein